MTESKESGISNMFKKVTDHLPNVNSIEHSVRQKAAVFNPNQAQETLSIQLLNKAVLSQSSDLLALSRETNLVSKNLYLWGKAESGEGLTDISDRLANLINMQALVEEECAKKIELGRTELKLIRNLGNELVAYRQKKELSAKQGHSSKLVFTPRDHELESMNSSTFDAYKREKLQRAFQIQFSAQKELGAKLEIISSFGELLCEELSVGGYEGAKKSAEIQAAAKAAIRNWKPSDNNSRATSTATNFDSSDSMSYGKAHPEMNNLNFDPTSEVLSAPIASTQSQTNPTPINTRPAPSPSNRNSLTSTSPTQGVASINLSPPPSVNLDYQNSHFSPQSHTLPLPTETGVPPVTIAETGVPLTGTQGPIKGDLSSNSRPGPLPTHPISLSSLGGGVPTSSTSLVGRDDLPEYNDAVLQGNDELRAKYEAENILAREREMKQGQH